MLENSPINITPAVRHGQKVDIWLQQEFQPNARSFNWNAEHGEILVGDEVINGQNKPFRAAKYKAPENKRIESDTIHVYVDDEKLPPRRVDLKSAKQHWQLLPLPSWIPSVLNAPITVVIVGGFLTVIIWPQINDRLNNGNPDVQSSPTLATPSPIPTQAPSPEVTIPPSPFITPTPVDACSGSNFPTLCANLQEGDWVMASLETDRALRNLMGLSNTSPGQELTVSGMSASEIATAIMNIPCNDLNEIDQLWVYYSGGRYGFTEQRKIWNQYSSNGTQNNWDTAEAFGANVGWYDPDVDEWKEPEYINEFGLPITRSESNLNQQADELFNLAADPPLPDGYYPHLADWYITWQGGHLSTLWLRWSPPGDCQVLSP